MRRVATAGVVTALAGTGILAGAGGAAAATPATATTVAHSSHVVTKAAEPRGKVVANGGLWVHQDANTTSKRLNLLSQGAVVALQCKKAGQNVDGNKLWYRLGAGKPGWVAARYVQNLAAVPYCK
ncbi:SH3 domain-containing protein [Streptomyces sp. RKAG293]|uniref:SH3 domain-containing protein n=1 Tax=Streptomyces sp. RKAG293 TaxID=2893403 RepID=UPI00203463C6|nr:SH3 domain-containing protein [Streptomyces sp. RKAG293]MCM2422754.1 SH3 domain-containing protein [Streptomyces sp. RKAG293]